MIGIIGDQHFKDNLSYSDYIQGGRFAEKKEVLDFVVESFSDCQHIVLMGDNFNSKNNSSETNREYVEFIERFGDKEVYILSGNHEKKGDGKTAIDFLGEIKRKNWHIFTKPSSMGIEGLKVDFLPYMLNSELGVESHEDATKKIMKNLDGGDILLAHHSISGTAFMGIKTDDLKEVVLPREKLEKKYGLVIAGHIHEPQQAGKTIITGSLFTDTVGEKEKFIWKIKQVTHNNVYKEKIYVIGDLGKWMFEIEKIKVPCREIHKVENPTAKQLSSIPKSAIIKAIVTNKSIDVEDLKSQLSKFDASLLIEDYPNERKKAHIEEGAFDFSIEALLKLYSEEKGVEYSKLLKGLQIING